MPAWAMATRLARWSSSSWRWAASTGTALPSTSRSPCGVISALGSAVPESSTRTPSWIRAPTGMLAVASLALAASSASWILRPTMPTTGGEAPGSRPQPDCQDQDHAPGDHHKGLFFYTHLSISLLISMSGCGPYCPITRQKNIPGMFSTVSNCSMLPWASCR